MHSHPSPNCRHRLKHLLTISFAVMLSACANFSDIQTTEKLKALPSGSLSNFNTAAAWPDNNWGIQIGGDALQKLINDALIDNPNLQAAAARVRSAQAVIDIAGAGNKPGFNIGINSTYERFPEHGLVPPPYGGSFHSDNSANFNVSYEIDFWGKHDAEMRSALSQEQVALAEQQSARLVLSTAIAHAWLQLARQSTQLDLSTQQLQERQKLDQLTQQRVRAGLDNESDVQTSVVQVSNLKTEIAQWQEAIGLTRNQLAALSGKAPEFGTTIAKPKLPSLRDQGVPDQIPAGLLGRRPDIVAARWRVEAAAGEIDVAKNLFYPNINLVGFAGLSSLDLDHFLEAGSAVVGVGPAIRLPIFVGGRLRGQLKGKTASYDAAVAIYNQSLTDGLRDVADQIQSLQAVETIAQQQQLALKAADTSVQLALQRQRIGTANVLPVVAAEINRLGQQKAALDTRIRRADLNVNLIKALGGGFQATLPATASSSKSPDYATTSHLPPSANKEVTQ